MDSRCATTPSPTVVKRMTKSNTSGERVLALSISKRLHRPMTEIGSINRPADFADLPMLAKGSVMRSVLEEASSAVFDLHAPGVMTGRDEWVYDFDVTGLRNKALFFGDIYNGFLDENTPNHSAAIKWSRDLRNELRRGRRVIYSEAERVKSLFRPFTAKWYCANFLMSDVLTRNHNAMFGSGLSKENEVILIKGPAAEYFSVLVTDKIADYKCGFTGNGGTFCLPLYRYTADGERVSNITEWGLQQFWEHYGDDGIGAEDVFAYVYAMLHDPAYRQRYEVDLRRRFSEGVLPGGFRLVGAGGSGVAGPTLGV